MTFRLKYSITGYETSDINTCYLKPPRGYTYEVVNLRGECEGEVLVALIGCDVTCFEKRCYEDPHCVGYTHSNNNQGTLMRTITGSTESLFMQCYRKPTSQVVPLYGNCLDSYPSFSPSDEPSLVPTYTSIPSGIPSSHPSFSTNPSSHPSNKPSLLPTLSPSEKPSLSISPSQSLIPTSQPSQLPSTTSSPSDVPSQLPSGSPSNSGSPSISAAPSSPYIFDDTDTLKSAVQKYINNTEEAIQLYGNISRWDVSAVSEFDRLFEDTLFNDDISAWDTSSSVTMFAMFR